MRFRAMSSINEAELYKGEGHLGGVKATVALAR